MNDQHDTDRDQSGTSDGGSSQSKDSADKRSPWEILVAKLRSIDKVKSVTKLRNNRDDARAMYQTLEGEREAIQAKLDATSDPLDRAAFTEDLGVIDDKKTTLDQKLKAINKRAEVLLEETAD